MSQDTGVGRGDFSLPFEYAELIITFAADQGVPANVLLSDTGLTVSDLMSQPRYIRSDSYSALAGNLSAATNDELLPWKYGMLLSRQPHGMFGLTLRSATRLSDAYEYLPEFFSTRTGGSQVLQTRRDTDNFDIVIKSGNPKTPGRVVWFHTIASLVNMAWISKILTGTLETEVRVSLYLTWKAPDIGDPTVFVPRGTQITFNHNESYLSLPAAVLRLRVKSGGQQINSAATTKLQQELSAPPKSLDTVGRVNWAIRKIGFKDSNVDNVSKLLGVSAATLKRRLQQKDQTFLNMKNSLRFEKVCELLTSTDKPLNEISYSVGYENPSNLSKAFRRRFGVSPGEFREHHGRT